MSAYVFKLFGMLMILDFIMFFSIFTLKFFDVLNSSFLLFFIVHVYI